MSSERWRGRRKRRPWTHVIGDLGVNFLERQVLRRGHKLTRVPGPEYGTDALMDHFSPETREIENGRVEFQVKATDNLKFVDNGTCVVCRVEIAHAGHWYWEIAHPFILVLYDAEKHRAFWIDIHSYLEAHPPRADTETLTIRIPVTNRLTLSAIDGFRKMSLARMASLTEKRHGLSNHE
jgi:hypothetical protein